MKKILAFLCGVITTCVGMTQQTHSTDEFTINFPDGWSLNTSGEMGTLFFIYAPLDNEEDLFAENVNLIVQDLSATEFDLTLEEFTQLSIDQINMLFTNANILAKGLKTLDGREFSYLDYEATTQGLNLRLVQNFCIADNKAWILTLTMQPGSYEKWSGEGLFILNSFRLR